MVNPEPRPASARKPATYGRSGGGRWSAGLSDRNPADWLPKTRQRRPAPTPVPEADLLRAMTAAPDWMRRAPRPQGTRRPPQRRDRRPRLVRHRPRERRPTRPRGQGAKGRSVRCPRASWGARRTGEGPVVGSRMTPKALSQAIGRFLRGRGIDYTAHKLRARYATRFPRGDVVTSRQPRRCWGMRTCPLSAGHVIASSDTMRRARRQRGRIG